MGGRALEVDAGPAPIPIWLGFQGPKNSYKAGLQGNHLLTAMGTMYEPYRQGLIDGGHDPASARMAGGLQAWVTVQRATGKPSRIISRHILRTP